MRPTWDESFMLHAMLAATRSSCLIRQVGAVLVRDRRVIASGYNGAPPNVRTCLETQVCFYQDLAHQDSVKGLGTFEQLKEERKEFCSAVHAEKNALNQCSHQGLSAVGSTLYTTNFPCPGCVRDAILPNKLAKVVVWKDYLNNRLLTMDEYEVSNLWLSQAGVMVQKLELPEARIKEIFGLTLQVGSRSSYQFTPKIPLIGVKE